MVIYIYIDQVEKKYFKKFIWLKHMCNCVSKVFAFTIYTDAVQNTQQTSVITLAVYLPPGLGNTEYKCHLINCCLHTIIAFADKGKQNKKLCRADTTSSYQSNNLSLNLASVQYG